MPEYWFKPRKFGLGFQPCCWQGGVVILVMVGLIFLSAYLNGLFTTPEDELASGQFIRFIISVIFVIILFMVRFKDKVQGKTKWHWGKIEQEPEDNQPTS